MKLPTYKRILREDLKDLPDSISQVLYPLNQFMETIYNTLNRNLTFSDNVLSFTKELTFTTSSTYTASGTWTPLSIAIPDNFQVKVSGVVVLQGGPTDVLLVAGSSPISIIWAEDNRTVQINWIAGLVDSTDYKFKFLVV